jgi:DNA-binding response OmpR family regulator
MPRRFRVLIVDDEERILNFLKAKLGVVGYDVVVARNGVEALEQVQVQQLDLVVLDLIMPQIDGLETLKRLRSFSALPVIVLSARDSDIDKIRGLELGADDYLVKPFNPDELVARIEAVRRRLRPDDKRKTYESVSLGDLEIDLQRRLVFVRGKETYLTHIEWLLLSELAQNMGQPAEAQSREGSPKPGANSDHAQVGLHLRTALLCLASHRFQSPFPFSEIS